MKMLTPEQVQKLIDNKKITMMFYFAGTGGDFLSQLVANNSSDFNDLAYTAYENNRFASVPIFNRFNEIHSDNFSDWINLDYFNMNHEIDYDKRIMVQDHYDDIVLNRIKKISKNVDAVFLDCGKNIKKYVELFLRKRHVEAPVDSSFRRFLEQRVTRNVSNQNKIISAVRGFDTVCLQDLCNFNNKLTHGVENPLFFHRTKDEIFREDMDKLVEYYHKQTEKLLNMKDDFNTFEVINIDFIEKSELGVLTNIKKVFKKFDINNARKDYEFYSAGNKKLLNNLSVSLWQNNTTIVFDDIKKAKPVLIVYPAGTGGEHIAHTLSVCNDDFEDLIVYKNEKTNIHNTQCFLNYSANMGDNIDNIYNPGYRGNFVDNKKRIVLKDHPTDATLNFYSKYLPDTTIIYIYVKKELDYFTNLTFKKLARKVKTPIDAYFIKTHVKNTALMAEVEMIQNASAAYDWVWMHELHIFVSGGYKEFKHDPDLTTSMKLHKDDLKKVYKSQRWKYGKEFKNIHYINCDTLVADSRTFWEQIGSIIPNTDVLRATGITDKWIEKNNSLNLPGQETE